MGKCVSKDESSFRKIREIDERSYIAITDEFEYYHYEDDGSYEEYYEVRYIFLNLKIQLF